MIDTHDIPGRTLRTRPTELSGCSVDFYFKAIHGARRRCGLVLPDHELSCQPLSSDRPATSRITITQAVEVTGIRGSNQSILTLNNIATIGIRDTHTEIDASYGVKNRIKVPDVTQIEVAEGGVDRAEVARPDW